MEARSEPRHRRRRLTRKQRFDQLLDAAEQLFIQRGYAWVSMEDVAQAAGVSRPVVYEHFPSKADLLLASVRRTRGRFLTVLADRIDAGAAPREQLAAGARAYFEALQQDPGRWRLFIMAESLLAGPYDAEQVRAGRELTEYLRGLIESWTRAPQATLESCAYALVGVADQLGSWWLSRERMSLDEVVEHYVAIAWSIIAPHVPR